MNDITESTKIDSNADSSRVAVDPLVIPAECGEVVEVTQLTRYVIDYVNTSEGRAAIDKALDEAFGEDNWYATRTGPKIIDFPKCSADLGQEIVEVYR